VVERTEKCEFCGKQLSKSGLRLHEKYCRQNPLKDLNKDISTTKVDSVQNLADNIVKSGINQIPQSLNNNSGLVDLRIENLEKQENLKSKKLDVELEKFKDTDSDDFDKLIKRSIQIEQFKALKSANDGHGLEGGKVEREIDSLKRQVDDLRREKMIDDKLNTFRMELLSKIPQRTNMGEEIQSINAAIDAVKKLNTGMKEKKDSAELVADLIERTISSPGVSGMLQELGKAASEKIRSPGSVNSSPKQEIQEIKTLTSNEIEQLDPQQLEYYNKFGSLPSSSGSEIEESASISHVSLSDPLTENPELNKYEEITEFVEVPKTIMEKVPVQITRKKEKPIEFSDLTNLSIQRD